MQPCLVWLSDPDKMALAPLIDGEVTQPVKPTAAMTLDFMYMTLLSVSLYCTWWQVIASMG